jgi:hypothetical protein
VVVGHGVDKPDISVILRRAIRDKRRLYAVLLQMERQMQPGNSGADNSDMPRHVFLRRSFDFG